MSDHPKFPETRVALMESWAKVGSTVGLQDAGVLFFKRIFELAPEALSMFSFGDEANLYESPKLKAHALKVMNTVGVAVGMLDDVPKLLPILADLGQKHVGYGVVPAHCEPARDRMSAMRMPNRHRVSRRQLSVRPATVCSSPCAQTTSLARRCLTRSPSAWATPSHLR